MYFSDWIIWHLQSRIQKLDILLFPCVHFFLVSVSVIWNLTRTPAYEFIVSFSSFLAAAGLWILWGRCRHVDATYAYDHDDGSSNGESFMESTASTDEQFFCSPVVSPFCFISQMYCFSHYSVFFLHYSLIFSFIFLQYSSFSHIECVVLSFYLIFIFLCFSIS